VSTMSLAAPRTQCQCYAQTPMFLCGRSASFFYVRADAGMFAETIVKTGFWLEDLAQELGNIPLHVREQLPPELRALWYFAVMTESESARLS